MDASLDPSLLFWYYLGDQDKKLRKRLSNPITGPYYFFRRNKSGIQSRLLHYFNHKEVPQVFLHGSPHIDNYVQTDQGFGIIDFDRAYVGPYLWDLVCVLLAVSLRNPETHQNPLPDSHYHTFFETYLNHLFNPSVAYLPFSPLTEIDAKDWEKDPSTYFQDSHKWGKYFKKSLRLPDKDRIAQALFEDYFRHLKPNEQDNLNHFMLKAMARGQGSFGRGRYLYWLIDRLKEEKTILIDIKETRHYLAYSWPHLPYYHNPFKHEGERMRAAAQLYAPQLALNESFATVNGLEYWGRHIPFLNRKPGKCFNQEDQGAFLISAGSQLGRGHGLQAKGVRLMAGHLQAHLKPLIRTVENLKAELVKAWQTHCLSDQK